MIDCDLSDKNAKRIGEMLEKNVSLIKVGLYGANQIESNNHSSSVTIDSA
jgi:hypothetical protein